ncbi:hypothetical protein COCSUDRAFT_66482 [Coccomyxa subellipsoidea C-169]|uniref:Uncharacterized protein n=1 Tax=Coccomyxa subellipsoidea (strain C-169) TaxID=574566 RepID=I0YUT7_COCSC|nr:hypothetical protein COCSUDRAFT_66482 [Coccomyxa subellipsoidea C-169]EIE22156.1 hypothetical protein COCSUDRAFT_66482 [Coccomyxa subellipsoidea C-169]|eukprot:XP_005646700.1 hypothetical protein COCSUDRAFT_66482 [Coccomyxa subellipsoidea C-169]
MATLLPLWVASGAVAGTVGLPVTASVGVVGILAALSSRSQKRIEGEGADREGAKAGSPELAENDLTDSAEAEDEQNKVCLSHALSSFTPRCHPLDQETSGVTWDTLYPSRQPSQLLGEGAAMPAALTQAQQPGLPKQRSQRYRKLVTGLSARLSTLYPACLAPKTSNTGAAQRASKQAAAGNAVVRRGRGGSHTKLDLLRTASSLQQRISVVASSASGPWIAHLC